MEYFQVGIPKNLATAIEKISPVLGYRSVSEFVVEAVRAHLRSMPEKHPEVLLLLPEIMRIKEFEADKRLNDIAAEKERRERATI